LDTRFICPTFNVVERLFSRTKLVMSDRRQRTLPVNLDMLIFLAINQRFWDAQTVQDAQA